jgi:hypothetical protein
MINSNISGRRASPSPYAGRVNPPARKGKPPSETGGHALTGGGPSQLGVDGSMRARDVSRPSEAAVENAEKTVRISRRSPPLPTPPTTGSDSAGG